MQSGARQGDHVSAGGKPGPGWYFNPSARKWVEITEADRAEAKSYVDRGFSQTSAKYRGVARFDDKWKELDKAELNYGVFASFREQKELDAALRRHLDRESRRPRAKRVVAIIRALSPERAEELMLDIATGRSNPEFDYMHEIGTCKNAACGVCSHVRGQE